MQSEWPWEPGEWDAFWVAVQRRPPAAIRLRRGFERPDLWPAGEPVPWHPDGRWCHERAEGDSASARKAAGQAVRLADSMVYAAGGYYIQDASSLLAVSLLDPRPGERICDLCAAPGGKSTAILEALAGHGWLLANEPIRSRWGALQFNLARHGAINYVLSQADPDTLADQLASQFDAVLVDAPCSGQSLLGRKKQTESAFNDPTVAHCAARQERILAAAQRLVRPGGRLVYSTCTFAPAENEQQVETLLRHSGDWTLEPDERLSAWQSRLLPHTYRLWPHLHACSGTFAARLIRRHLSSDSSNFVSREHESSSGQRGSQAWPGEDRRAYEPVDEERQVAEQRQADRSSKPASSARRAFRRQDQRRMLHEEASRFDHDAEDEASLGKPSRKPSLSGRTGASTPAREKPSARFWQACSLPTAIEEWGQFTTPPMVWGNGVQQFAWPCDLLESWLQVGLAGPELAFRKGETWFPAYALAMRRDETWQPREIFALTDDEARKYLRGEPLHGQAQGWCLATWQGLPLGWLKGDGKTLKNHLPKPGRCVVG